MMIHINFIISLIKYIEKSRPCHLTLLLAHRKLCLSVKIQTFNVSTESITQVQDNLESNNHDTKEDNSKKICTEKKIKRKDEYKFNQNIKNYMLSINPQVAEICPQRYMKCQGGPISTMYLFEKETAKKFVDVIIDDLSKNMTYVAEANPGAGLLTEELLKAGVTNVHAYEPNECFHPILGNLQRKYPNKLTIQKNNLFKMSKLLYMDNLDNKNRVESIFMNIKQTPWEERSCMQVIGALTDFVFFKHLIMCVVFQSCFMLRGRTCFYLAIPPSLWNVLNVRDITAKRYSKYVLFQTLFDFKYLGDLKRISYVPWQTKKLKIFKNYDHEMLVVIKLEPKANLFVDYLEQKQLLPYWYFVRHHIKSQKRRIIPDLEKWVPGCGIRLIEKNYNIFTQFVDLEPNEILNLYKEFASWPEYENCLFLRSAKSYIQIINQDTSISCIDNDDLSE